MKFNKKRTWISPERYSRIIKMLKSDNEDDFLIGSQILAELDIKPKVLLNNNIQNAKYNFFYKGGVLTRNEIVIAQWDHRGTLI